MQPTKQNFKVGDTVRCVDDSGATRNDGGGLQETLYYIVERVEPTGSFISVKNVVGCYLTERFVLVGPAGKPLPSNIKEAQDLNPSPPSASKHDSTKPDLSLIPPEALVAAAKALMVGEKKYGRYNYYKGHNASQLIAAMMRHATAWMDGEENDPTDGQPHLGSVIACAAMILKQQALGTLKDNRYKKDGDK